MAPTSRRPEPDGDGVRVTDPPGLRRAASVLGLVAIVVGLGTFLVISIIRRGVPPKGAAVEATPPREPGGDPGSGATAHPIVAEPPRLASVRPHAVRHATAPTPEPAPPAAGAVPAPAAPGEVSAKDVIETMNAGGVHTGIAAFSPPGTKPVKRGVVVPDGFELPEGFVRHYQATDDGKQLPPILTLHPDYDLVDGTGEHVALGDDRVVPPEMAPAGLPVRLLDLPDAPGGSDRPN